MWKQKTPPMETTLLPWALRRGWEEKYGVLKYFQLLLTGYLREYSTDQRCSVPGAVVKAWGRTVVAAFDQLWFIFATENCIYWSWNHSVCGWKGKRCWQKYDLQKVLRGRVEQNIIGNREETCKASFTRRRMWVIIQEPKSGEAWVLFSQKKVLLSASAGGAIKTYECGLARWALPPGSSLLVAREGGDIRVN